MTSEALLAMAGNARDLAGHLDQLAPRMEAVIDHILDRGNETRRWEMRTRGCPGCGICALPFPALAGDVT